MKFKLVITNETKQQKAKILYAVNLNEKNFGLPEGVVVEVKNKDFTYEKILQHLTMRACLIKFISSTNNRQLFFWYQNAMGSYAIEPQKNIDGTLREKYRGESFKLGKDTIYEGDLFYNWFTNKWNPKKWNIADTHEITIWTFSNFIDLYIKKKQVFELEFTAKPLLDAKPMLADAASSNLLCDVSTNRE